MAVEPVIRMESLSKQYFTQAGPVPALTGLNIVVTPGEFLAIMGPSGSGKSTFMNIAGCLDIPTAGGYYLNGTNVSSLDKDRLARLRNNTIGFVFQGFNLLARASLLDNVGLPLVYSGVKKKERCDRAREMLERVGLGKYLASFPNRISGGQQQRVAIARALVNHPKLLLADEPTGNLDTKTSREIMEIFTRLNRVQGITIVLVTHEEDIAGYARRHVRFKDGLVEYDRTEPAGKT